MFPITLNNKDELIQFVKNNESLIREVLDVCDEKDSKLLELENKLLEKQNKIDELVNLKTGIEKGVSSYHIGEFNEKVLQEELKRGLEDWDIDKVKKMHAMDIRIFNQNKTIGIECKRKKCITSTDINKFKKDKLTNQFDGNIFISTSKIPKLVENINNCLLLDNNLYIYSEDTTQIINFIKVYLEFINTNEQIHTPIINHDILNELILNHNKQKKILLEQDKTIINIMRNLNINTKGFLYFSVASKFKGHIPPY